MLAFLYCMISVQYLLIWILQHESAERCDVNDEMQENQYSHEAGDSNEPENLQTIGKVSFVPLNIEPPLFFWCFVFLDLASSVILKCIYEVHMWIVKLNHHFIAKVEKIIRQITIFIANS